MRFKIGIWDNPEKLNKTFNKVAVTYGFIIIILGVIIGAKINTIVGGLICVLSFPLWIISFSYNDWKENRIEGEK